MGKDAGQAVGTERPNAHDLRLLFGRYLIQVPKGGIELEVNQARRADDSTLQPEHALSHRPVEFGASERAWTNARITLLSGRGLHHFCELG